MILSSPTLSVVIPVYNEQDILQAAVTDLRANFASLGHSYEILLMENGSTDRTVSLAQELCARTAQEDHGHVHLFSVGEPNYGRALKEGILHARGEFVICEEIDLCDVDFHRRALALLETDEVDLVIGSKLLAEANDSRPFVRHAASLAYSMLLRLAVGFRGTDTHGLKAFRRQALLPVLRACVVEKDVFASELVLRASRAGLALREIPIQVAEKRPPSVHLFKRVPNVLKSVAKLTYAIRFRG